LLRARLSNTLVSVRGKASDNVAVSEVRLKVNNGDFAPASGTTNWMADALLAPGTNVLIAQSFDLEGRGSRLASTPVFFVVPSPLTLTSTGSGRTTGPTNGQVLEVGRGYKLTATAGATFLFSHWSGDLLVSNAILNFIMQSNMVLQ